MERHGKTPSLPSCKHLTTFYISTAVGGVVCRLEPHRARYGRVTVVVSQPILSLPDDRRMRFAPLCRLPTRTAVTAL